MFSFRSDSHQYTFYDLEPYKVYYFVLAAETLHGQGPFSSTMPFRTGEAGRSQSLKFHNKTHLIASGPSASPDNLRVDVLGPNYAELTWDEPSPDSHNGIIRFYTLSIVEEETFTSFTLTSSNTQILMTYLHPFYNYSVTVAAVTASPGPFSQQLTFRTLQAGMYHYSFKLLMSYRLFIQFQVALLKKLKLMLSALEQHC